VLSQRKLNAKLKEFPFPRYWKVEIGRITGLNFCDRTCGCGDNNELWWFPVCADVDDWVPGWMNGADSHEIWDWLVEHDKVPKKRKRKKK
jgi:hypothetical protein